MQCEDVRNRLADALRDELPSALEDEWQQHLRACEACRLEVLELRDLWKRLGDIPAGSQPTGAGDRFERLIEAFLAGYEDSRNFGTGNKMSLRRLRLRLSAPIGQAGLAAALVLLGVVVGRVVPPRGPSASADLTEVRQELHAVRQMLTLSLLQQPSATARLQGVTGSTQLEQPGTEVVNALLDALRHDPTVNVRLASVDALRRFSDRDTVRRATLQTLTQTPFPMVQIALIDFLVDTKETSAVPTLRQLSEDPAVNESVRSRAAWGLQRLTS
jgi:hypothetical protein